MWGLNHCLDQGRDDMNIAAATIQLIDDRFGSDDQRSGDQGQFTINAPVGIQARVTRSIGYQRMYYRNIARKCLLPIVLNSFSAYSASRR